MVSFSVIIPTYNRQAYVDACLDSVAAQRHRPHEVIVVDDGSTDGTCEIVEAHDGAILIRQANAGPGAARNRGAEVASGDYLAFLDSDDLWFPCSLEVMADLIAAHDRPTLLFARFEDFSGDTPLEAGEVPAEGQAYADFLSSTADGRFAGAGMMVVEREAFLATGGFAEDRVNAEDHDLALRLGTARGFVQVTAPVSVAHRVHAGNEMGDGEKNLLGLARLVLSERSGLYPGGTQRRRARQDWIAGHVRAALLSDFTVGHFSLAAGLYAKTFSWNLSGGRLRFLAAAPPIASLRSLKAWRRSEKQGPGAQPVQ